MVPVPDYLNETYWWAYVHPNAVKFFERQWLVNAILWGNFSRLRDWALDELSNPATSQLEGSTLQIACVYGDLTPKMVQRLKSDASLTVVDVVQAQLDNLSHKLDDQINKNNVHLLQRDASHLDGVADKSFDQVLLFFLLHEMPEETRRKTLAEATRVVKPGGRIIIVDYHRPHKFNPHRIIMYPVLKYLEPFALDIWANEVSSWLPEAARSKVTKSVCFGGLYQKIIVNM
jgi:ubiquinone/menaquinone biosynthesis C-methylase UbiE